MNARSSALLWTLSPVVAGCAIFVENHGDTTTTPRSARTVTAPVAAPAGILARPLPAARRLARALGAEPHLALRIAITPTPRTRLYSEPEYDKTRARAFDDAYD